MIVGQANGSHMPLIVIGSEGSAVGDFDHFIFHEQPAGDRAKLDTRALV